MDTFIHSVRSCETRLMAVALGLVLGTGVFLARPVAAQCIDHSNDPAGCQPSTFDTPIGQMPSVRVGAMGELDPFSSEADARTGFSRLEDELHLFRNFEHLHWVLTVPSEKDPATGGWRGGDLDGGGDARGMGIAGNCLYVGHRNGAGVVRGVNILRIQPDPVASPPVSNRLKKT